MLRAAGAVGLRSDPPNLRRFRTTGASVIRSAADLAEEFAAARGCHAEWISRAGGGDPAPDGGGRPQFRPDEICGHRVNYPRKRT